MKVRVIDYEVDEDVTTNIWSASGSTQTMDTKVPVTITVQAEDVEGRTFGETVAEVDVISEKGRARFFVTVTINDRGVPVALIHAKDRDGDEHEVSQRGWYRPTKRDLALRATEGMPRERMVEMLESIAIQCYDSEDDATLREALVESIEVGDLEMPE